MQVITPVTRRDLRAGLGRSWSERLTEAEFLSRLYDLTALPSTDPRHENMLGDVHTHCDQFPDDWADDWIFDDARLGLDDDERLLRVLAETLHPEVVTDNVDPTATAARLNTLLRPDGFEIFAASSMSGRPVFSWRRTTPRKAPVGEFPSSLIAGLSQIIPDLTTSTGIDSMFEVEDFPSPENLGVLNKPEKVKSWLRTAQADAAFDHWNGLAQVLKPILEDTSRVQDEPKAQILAVLAKRGITYLTGGMLTTSPQVELAGLPASAPPTPTNWTEIGRGGFGVVFRANDPRLEIDFALKVFDPYPRLSLAEARARFTREAGLLFRLRHENIAASTTPVNCRTGAHSSRWSSSTAST